jgi:hypothetical protein
LDHANGQEASVMVNDDSGLITPFSDNQEPLSDYINEQDLGDKQSEIDQSEISQAEIEEPELIDLRKRKATKT